MRSLLQRCALVLGAAVGLLGTRPATANAQKALVYCPVSIDATGCNAIVAALTGPGYPLGVDRGYDGTDGTVDLKTVDLFSYSVFVVPSLADDSTSQPYAKLRDPEVAEHLKAALIGRLAMWSGTPDQGATNRTMKDALIQNLVGWAGGAFATAKGPGLVAFLDASASAVARYDWVRAIAPLPVTSDPALLIYNNVRALNQRATTILTSAAGAIAYSNMATFGFQVPNGAAGVNLDAVGQTGTSQGGQVVLLTMEAGNASGATVRTDRDDYSPGTTVVITGSGWEPNETVKLTLHMDPLRDSDTELTATADASGNFTNTQFAPGDYDVGVRFVLTAVGQASGRRAQATFTDGNKVSFSTTAAGAEVASFGTVAANACFSAFVQERQGNTLDVAPPGGRPVSLSSTASGATFFAGSGCAGSSVTSVTIPAGQPAIAFSFTLATAGLQTINGNAGFSGSSNAATTITVTAPAAVNTTTTLASSANPSVFGQSVTFTATVSAISGTPTGTVTFKEGATTLGTGTLAAGQATFSTSTLSAGSHSITAEYAGVAGSFNPSISAALSQQVNQAQTSTALVSSLNPSTFGQSVTFTATVSPVGPGAGTPTGTVDFKDGATAIGSGTLSNVGGAQKASFSTTALTVATHNITATYTGSTNFATSTSVLLAQVVNAIATNLTVDPATATYGGTVDLKATLKAGSTPLSGKTVTFTLNGTICGDAVTDGNGEAKLLAVSLTGINAGTYPAGAGSGVQADFTGDPTMSASTAGATLTVNKRLATWTTQNASKTYGDVDPNPLTTGSGDFLAADGVSATYTRAPGETVLGGPYHITATLAPAGVLSNYTVTNAGANFTIDPRAATWTTNAASKTYGDVDPNPLTTGSGTFLAADGVTASYSRAVGETVLGGPYHITATLAPAGVLSNYTVTNAGANFTIDPRAATWTTNAASKTYGDVDPNPLTTGSGTFLAADGVTASYSRAVGETVLGGPYHITATLAPAGVLSNYTVTNAGANFTIDPRAATWTTNAASKTYGDVDPNPLTTGSGTFLAADGVSATYTRAPGETVLGGPYHITATLAPAGVLSNYTVTNAGANFTIDPRAATWTTNAASKTYGDVDPNPLTTGSGTFLAADGVSATYTRAPGETVLGGPYHITATLTPAAVLSNYTITNAGANFTIDPRAATWTTNAASKTYGDVDPNPLTTGSGTFLAADGVSATYTRAPGETVLGGPYHITATLAPAGVLSNYTVTNAGANFTIDPRAATWTTNAASKTYGDVDPNPLTTGSGTFLAADGVSATYTRAPGETVLGGPYHITATLTPAAVLTNYTITNAGANFTIDPRAATWTTNAASKTYGDVDPNPLTTGSGTFLAADGVSATYTRAPGETVLGGPYHITATLAPAGVLSNYTVTNTGANFTINKRLATWTTQNASKTFGQLDPVPLTTGAGSNFVMSDGVTASYTRVAGENVAAVPYHITAALSSVVANALDNYTITNNGADFTINKATPTISWTGLPATINQGDALTAAHLNAFAQSIAPTPPPAVAGTMVYKLLPLPGTTVTAGTQVFGMGAKTIQADFTPSDGNYTAATATRILTVNNVAPTVISITLPSVAIALGSPASLTAKFLDPGLTDTHTYSIDWDWDLQTNAKTPDSYTSPFAPVASEPTGVTPATAGTVSSSNAYTAPGVYTVRVTVKDNGSPSLTGDRTSAVELFAYIIVFDASGGFVTGGGWIDSPQGACKMNGCTNLTVGKANFGFVSKYKKGQSEPDGNTEFQFKAGDINFHSSTYDWLVVAGAKAQFKGLGQINGSGNYGFLITAIDGQINGGGGVDKFRIKIWDKNNNDVVVYDNQMGAADDGTPTMSLGGGSINIQAK